MLIQQGDVLFHKIDKLPDNVVPVKPEFGRFVFARGEVTGHAHTTAANLGRIEVFEDAVDRVLYAVCHEDVIVRHEEHKQVKLPAGTKFKIGIVEEVDPFTEEVRKVSD